GSSLITSVPVLPPSAFHSHRTTSCSPFVSPRVRVPCVRPPRLAGLHRKSVQMTKPVLSLRQLPSSTPGTTPRCSPSGQACNSLLNNPLSTTDGVCHSTLNYYQ